MCDSCRSFLRFLNFCVVVVWVLVRGFIFWHWYVTYRNPRSTSYKRFVLKWTLALSDIILEYSHDDTYKLLCHFLLIPASFAFAIILPSILLWDLGRLALTWFLHKSTYDVIQDFIPFSNTIYCFLHASCINPFTTLFTRLWRLYNSCMNP